MNSIKNSLFILLSTSFFACEKVIEIDVKDSVPAKEVKIRIVKGLVT